MSAPLLLLKPAFSPAKLAGLSLWLSADRITGLADGDPVSSWSDLSGNSNHATQSTTAAKPLYKVNIANGRPGVLFDGVDDYLSLAAGAYTAMLAGDKTVFVAAKWAATGADKRLVSVSNAGASTRFALTHTTGPVYQHFYTTGAAQANVTASAGAIPSTSVPQIVEAVQSGTSFIGRTNGTTIAADPANAGGEVAASGALGSNAAGSGGFANVYILDVIAYNRALSATEASAVRRYLGVRYGVTVS